METCDEVMLLWGATVWPGIWRSRFRPWRGLRARFACEPEALAR